jgi:hypothetical protein
MSELDECLNTIKELYEKYKNDNYLLQRLKTRVLNYLPNELQTDSKKHERNQNRVMYLTAEKNVFVELFLSQNKYYYLHSNNCFFYYNNKNYSIVKADDIIYKLLSTISQNYVLIEWKHKTKKQILGAIKERSLFDSIPETETIQNVLNVLFPSIFKTKSEAKYFLTILGDSILKKNNNLIFLVPNSLKKLLNEIDAITFFCLGSTFTQNFMSKYHENHNYANCRLLKVIDNFHFNILKELIIQNGLNLICVATHYSKRYDNSDNFLEVKACEDLKNYTYYLKLTCQTDLVKNFIEKCIQPAQNEKMEWKKIHFVWKQFLNNLKIPNVLFSATLKTLLKEKIEFHEETDSFLNITSCFLPIESDFISFWQQNITLDENNEIEIEELGILFKNWLKTNEKQVSNIISDEYILKIIKHFFSNVEIEEDKYILNFSSKIWNKKKDINLSFQSLQIIDEIPFVTFEKVYENYCLFCRKNNFKFIASKRYVEKFIAHDASSFVLYDQCIKNDYFLFKMQDLKNKIES